MICEICGEEFESPAINKKRRTCSRSCAVALAWKDNDSAERRRLAIIAARNTMASRRASTEVNNRRWARPGEREKLSERNRKIWKQPGMRKKLTKAIQKTARTPEHRAMWSRLRAELWTDPDYRQKTVEGIRKSKGTPEARALFSQLLTERWNDPEMRAKYTAANATKNSPEFRASISARMIKRWREDDNYRATALAALELYCSNPETVEVKRAKMKALWADPIWRARQLDLISKNQNTPVRIRNGIKTTALNEATDIMAAVDAVVPRGLPDFMRMDIASDIIIALFEGHLQISNLKAEAGAYMTAHRKMFPDKWGPISIDAPLPGTDGLTLSDTFSNETPHF